MGPIFYSLLSAHHLIATVAHLVCYMQISDKLAYNSLLNYMGFREFVGDGLFKSVQNTYAIVFTFTVEPCMQTSDKLAYCNENSLLNYMGFHKFVDDGLLIIHMPLCLLSLLKPGRSQVIYRVHTVAHT